MNDPKSALSYDEILQSQDVSYWLKDAIKAAMQRDPVDALNDAELLVKVLRRRVGKLLSNVASVSG